MEFTTHHLNTEEKRAYAELITLADPDPCERIPVDDCEPGYLYYGQSRSMQPGVAICHITEPLNGVAGRTRFAVRDVWCGRDYLFEEVHFDEEACTGTWLPFVRLEKVPEGLDAHGLLSWLIDQEVALHEDRLQWFRGMPDRLQRAESYEAWRNEAQQRYEAAVDKKAHGVSLVTTELSHAELVRARIGQSVAHPAKYSALSAP